jgi:hypothetical protein
MKMGLKNPAYEKKPDVPGGDGGDNGPDSKPKSTEIVVIILAIVIVIATLILLYVCIKRKQKNDQTFMFNKNKDFGAIKQGNSGQKVVRNQKDNLQNSESDF